MGGFKLIIEPPDLTWYQKEILYNPARFTITEASTKAGKTFSHIWWLYEEAHKSGPQEGRNYWWVAPVYGQAKIAFNRLRKTLRDSGLYTVNKTELSITCPNGAVIWFKTAKDPDNLYGEDVYAAVFDEAPRAKYDAYVALYTTLTATKGKLKMIGNFGGISNWMHLLKEKSKSDPQYSYHKITAWDAVKAGILDKEVVDQAQADLPPKIFKQLYLAEAQESEDMLCTYDSIRDLWTNSHVVKGDRYITADIALHGSDKFVVIVWEGYRVININIVDKCEADEVEKLLKSTAEKYKVGRSNIVYDADGLGSFLRGYLKGAKPFNNGGKPMEEKNKTKVNYKNLKAQCGYLFAKLVNRKEVFFDEFDADDIKLKTAIMQELEMLQSYALDSEGKMQLLPKKKIIEIIGHSPDILDALIMRVYFDLKPKARKPKNARMI